MANAAAGLIHASVGEPARRARQVRLLAALFAAPFFFSAATSLLLAAPLGVTGVAVAILIFFATFWGAALAVSATGRDAAPGLAALAVACAGVAMLGAGAGGFASPAALLLAALPLEVWWVGRSRAALRGGAAAVLVAATGMMLVSGLPAAAPHAAHWILPLGYAALTLPRMVWWQDDMPDEKPAGDSDWMELLDGIVLRFQAGCEVLEASGPVREAIGVAPEMLLGAGLFERVRVGDRVALMRALSAADGSPRRIELSLRCLSAEGESLYRPFVLTLAGAGRAAVLRSNETVHELRAALEAAREEAASAEIAQSRFLASVSHELRTPLNAIIGFSDMLLHEMFGPLSNTRQKEYVRLVQESGRHLLGVVSSILDVSRIACGAYSAYPETFRFSEAMALCEAMLRPQAEEKGVDLRIEVAEAGELVADRRALQQILINLMSNAIKFTPAGGRVVVGATRGPSRLHLWVSDTGIGIAEEDLARIGQPFTQVQNDLTRNVEGAGLGLSLVKGLVGLHQGTMTIDSAPGLGTTVSVGLPLDGPARPSTSAEIVSLPTAGGKEASDGTLRKAG